MAGKKVHSGEVPSTWRDFLNDEEKQRLDVLDRREALKKRIIEREISEERRKIMRRAIKRKRRSEGLK